MSLSEINQFLPLIQQAPEYLRRYLEFTFWILIFLLLLWAILKVLFNKQFKEFYRFIGVAAKMTRDVGKILATEAARNLVLPEPYPKLMKFFAIVAMINGYLASFFFVCFALTITTLLMTSETPGFWARTGGILFLVVLIYAAWAFFAQSERDHISLFRKTAPKQGEIDD